MWVVNATFLFTVTKIPNFEVKHFGGFFVNDDKDNFPYTLPKAYSYNVFFLYHLTYLVMYLSVCKIQCIYFKNVIPREPHNRENLKYKYKS